MVVLRFSICDRQQEVICLSFPSKHDEFQPVEEIVCSYIISWLNKQVLYDILSTKLRTRPTQKSEERLVIITHYK